MLDPGVCCGCARSTNLHWRRWAWTGGVEKQGDAVWWTGGRINSETETGWMMRMAGGISRWVRPRSLSSNDEHCTTPPASLAVSASTWGMCVCVQLTAVGSWPDDLWSGEMKTVMRGHEKAFRPDEYTGIRSKSTFMEEARFYFRMNSQDEREWVTREQNGWRGWETLQFRISKSNERGQIIGNFEFASAPGKVAAVGDAFSLRSSS